MAPASTSGSLDGEPFTLEGLLAFQEGAVVSRTCSDEDAGTLTAFAVDETERLTEHTAPHRAIRQRLEGTPAVTIPDERPEVSAGEAIGLPAHGPHAVDAVTRFGML